MENQQERQEAKNQEQISDESEDTEVIRVNDPSMMTQSQKSQFGGTDVSMASLEDGKIDSTKKKVIVDDSDSDEEPRDDANDSNAIIEMPEDEDVQEVIDAYPEETKEEARQSE